MKFSFLAFLIIFSLNAFAIDIKDVEMFGYARAGVGTNTHGGDQECFYNQGSGGWGGIGRNEFRLGNECSNYLELGMRFNHLKTESKNVFTQFRLSNSHNGDDQSDSASQSTNFVEAFAEIKGVDNLPWLFWAGKRFYREQDVYIDDYYYFGSMNGNGGGVGNIDLLGGKFSFAYFRQVSSTRTTVGMQGLTVYDARLKQVELAPNIKQNFWIAYGTSPESSNVSTGAKYKKANGAIAGTLVEWNLGNFGFNHFAVMFGQGVMNNFNLYGDSTVTLIQPQSSEMRLRIINHTTYDINSRWVFHLSLNHERLSVHGDTTEQWSSIGVRPLYRVTNQFHLVGEAGTSLVQNAGKRTLTRLTFAPQVSINENIWGRPVVRAFYTQSFWNGKNKSFVALNAPTYAKKTTGGSFGLQMESFF